ncbi:MAG TPA: TetR/AcrR family transcriptional regulator [Propionicimonas sp.]|uniref:TetR/AcrR family transcriptional regulator n=1 Tax=Propionicimonas sp. TaxID=1955623 RepID=UPI002F408B07
MGRRPAFDEAEVLEHAQDAFWANGYEGTSLEDLLQATGLSKSSLYSSFGGKEKLFLTCFDRYRSDRAAEMQAVLAAAPGLPGVREFFRLIIERDPTSSLGFGCLSMNQGFEQAHRAPAIRDRVGEDLDLIRAALRDALAEGQRLGQVRPDADIAAAAASLTITFVGFQLVVRAQLDRTPMIQSLDYLLGPVATDPQE